MKTGFSLSPGGLLLPYHLGALECLVYEGRVVPQESMVAGSSAGAIATMAHGCGLSPKTVLEATIRVSDQAAILGGARGRLLPLLEGQMEQLVGDAQFEYLMASSATTEDVVSTTNIGIAYRQLFPRRKNYLQASFSSRNDLFEAVSSSCMFPFFATNWPFRIWKNTDDSTIIDFSSSVPRVVVDGFFSVPRERFGCPDFEGQVDRTVAISVFPHATIGLTALDAKDIISPSPDDIELESLFRIATQASSREELTQIYELGYKNAESFCRQDVKLQ